MRLTEAGVRNSGNRCLPRTKEPLRPTPSDRCEQIQFKDSGLQIRGILRVRTRSRNSVALDAKGFVKTGAEAQDGWSPPTFLIRLKRAFPKSSPSEKSDLRA